MEDHLGMTILDFAKMNIPDLPDDLSDYDVTVTITIRKKPDAEWVASRQLRRR